MSQQWEYRAVYLSSAREFQVNDELRKWAREGYELVNGSVDPIMHSGNGVWLFWRRAVQFVQQRDAATQPRDR